MNGRLDIEPCGTSSGLRGKKRGTERGGKTKRTQWRFVETRKPGPISKKKEGKGEEVARI